MWQEACKRSIHPSIAASLIDALHEPGPQYRDKFESIARSVCSSPYLAGAETTSTLGVALLYALANHPHVQRRAQAEIDSVIGHDRLARVTDRKALPYIQAVIKELTRWYTVNPLGEFVLHG